MTALPPDTLRVRTAENVSLGYAVAGLGSRLTAQVIDNLLAFTLVLVALLAYSAIASTATTVQGMSWAVGGAIAFSFFVYVLYFLISEAVSSGRTLGKAAMGLRVLRLDGGAVDFASVAVRNIVRILDLAFGIGILVMFFHPMARRLGDLAAGTVVVRERSHVSLAAVAAPPPVMVRTPDSGPRVDGIDRLGRSEQETLRAFLSRQGLTPELRARLAGQIATRLCERMQLPPSAPERMWPPELLIERVYMQLEERLR